MRVRLDRLESVHRSLRWRSVVLLLFGVLGIVLGSFLLLLGLLMFVMDHGGLWERRTGVVLGIFGGFFPLAIAALMAWRGLVGRRRMTRLRDIAALARLKPMFRSQDVSEALGLKPLDAERAVVDAATMGLIEEDPAEAQARQAMAMAPTAPAWPSAPPARSPGTPVPEASGVRRPAALVAHAPAADAWIGAVLNGVYRIEGHVGSGGMGAVYAARHLRTGRRYAVKTLLPDARLSPDAIKRFEREATAASALGHPGIVAVHDFHETESGLHYLVMDLLEGETLEQRLGRAGSLPWPEAQRIALEVGSALSAAHDAGLLHRDLKPANIFLTRSPGAPERAVLLDFGLAKPIGDAQISRITTTGAAVGTPVYMSPEQARGEALDVRSDVYGLGAVIYEMVTGAPPFLDTTLAGVYARLLTESAPAASAAAAHPCPPAVDDLLSCALAKRREERFDNLRAFTAALSHVGAPVQRSA